MQATVEGIRKELDKLAAEELPSIVRATSLLAALGAVPMTLDILRVTRVGKSVNALRKVIKDAAVVTLARDLIGAWRVIAGDPVDADVDAAPSVPSATATRGVLAATPSRVVKAVKVLRETGSGASLPVCGDPKRDTTREKLLEILRPLAGTGEIAVRVVESIETAIFNAHTESLDDYKSAVRSRLANLRLPINKSLRERLISGDITPAQFAVMTSDELSSPELQIAKEEAVKKALHFAVTTTSLGTHTTEYKCSKCGAKDAFYSQKQTRSSDEPMTMFFVCNNCGKRWKM